MVSSQFKSRIALGCRIALTAVALAGLGWCTHVFTQRLVRLNNVAAIPLLGVPALVAFFSIYAALRFDNLAVRRVVREMIFVGITLIAAELSIAIWAPELASAPLTRNKVASEMHLPFDLRTKSQVVAKLQSENVDALPGVLRDWPRQSGIRQQLPENFYPLTHASNAQIVECNEGGEYFGYTTDEFGLNNPKGLVSSRNIDVALLGGAFAVGHCVPVGQSFVDVLRKNYSRLANFAMAGSGPLSSLATFFEYIEPLHPKLVVWAVNGPMSDVSDESTDPVLGRYLEPTFTQNLLSRQESIDRTWRELAVSAQFEFDRRARVLRDRANNDRFERITYLYNLRHRFGIDRLPIEPKHVPNITAFLNYLELAKQRVESWGGNLVVVVEPLYEDIVAHRIEVDLSHERLASAIRAKKIVVIDAVEAVENIADREGLYTLRIGNHLNADGNAIVGEFVAAKLKQLPAGRGE